MLFKGTSLVLQTRKTTDFSLAVAFHIETRALNQLDTDVTKAQSRGESGERKLPKHNKKSELKGLEAPYA